MIWNIAQITSTIFKVGRKEVPQKYCKISFKNEYFKNALHSKEPLHRELWGIDFTL